MPFVGVIPFYMVSFILNEDLSIVIGYGIPHSVWTAIWLRPIVTYVVTQVFYFYFICFYFKTKINNFNAILVQIKRKERMFGIGDILNRMNALYREIHHFDSTYWSKFLFIIWLFLGSIITILIYIIVFIEVNVIIKVVLIYGTLLCIVLFNFIFSTASSLNSKINKSYNYLNSILAQHSMDTRLVKIARLNNTIKVCIEK